MSVYECGLTDTFHCKTLFTVGDSSKFCMPVVYSILNFKGIKKFSHFSRTWTSYFFSPQLMHFCSFKSIYQIVDLSLSFSNFYLQATFMHSQCLICAPPQYISMRLHLQRSAAEGRRTTAVAMASCGGCSWWLGIYQIAEQIGGVKGMESKRFMCGEDGVVRM